MDVLSTPNSRGRKELISPGHLSEKAVRYIAAGCLVSLPFHRRGQYPKQGEMSADATDFTKGTRTAIPSLGRISADSILQLGDG